MLLTLLKLLIVMTKGEEVGRTVPAKRANPPPIILLPSFNELLSHRGAERPFFFCTSESLHRRAHLW